MEKRKGGRGIESKLGWLEHLDLSRMVRIAYNFSEEASVGGY
jgi:hypothetical protein